MIQIGIIEMWIQRREEGTVKKKKPNYFDFDDEGHVLLSTEKLLNLLHWQI
jgi:hypothetical protein